MKIMISDRNGVGVINLEGSIDLYNAKQVGQAIDKVIADGKKKILMDFANVTYIDSTGIGSLLAGLQDLKKTGGKMKFYNVRESVSQVFKIANLLNYLDFYNTEEEALAAFDA